MSHDVVIFKFYKINLLIMRRQSKTEEIFADVFLDVDSDVERGNNISDDSDGYISFVHRRKKKLVI